MLRGICPNCGLIADLDVFALQGETNAALRAALDLPSELGGQIIAYLRLFSPPKKSLSLRKAARLLTELNEQIRAAQVHRHGIIWAAPLAIWKAALEIVVSTPPQQLPLTNHNYLFQIVANLASSVAQRKEQQQEDQRKHPLGPRDGGPQPITKILEQPAQRTPPPRDWRDRLVDEIKGTTGQQQQLRDAAKPPPFIISSERRAELQNRIEEALKAYDQRPEEGSGEDSYRQETTQPE